MRKFFLLTSIFLLCVTFINTNYSFADHEINEHFAPFKGTSTINSDSNGRYSTQLMYWRNMQEFDAINDTYEHETIFYNYDNKAYASTHTGVYQTNLPDPYLDTQAIDGNNEYNIAVGTFDPEDLNAATWYSYTVRLNTTTSTGSYYKISGQEGYSLCETSNWCVENHQTAILIPFKDPFKAPESNRDFKYEWESNNSMSLADNIDLGDWGSGVINTGSDVDYWSFDVPSSRTVYFILKVPNSVDYDVHVYDSNGNFVTSGTNNTGIDESFSKYLTAGRYYIKVYSFSGSNSVATYNVIPY